MRQKNVKKKMVSLLLAAAMILTSFPVSGKEAQAAGTSDHSLSVKAFATKDQLMSAFTPDKNGSSSATPKLAFGKDSTGAVQKWYILGNDTGVAGDNTVLFAAGPIATKQKFDENFNISDESNATKSYDADWGCTYTGNAPTEVNVNHYGGSDVRAKLNEIAGSTQYFTNAEQGLMNVTTVKTKDTKADADYTTTDKLYALTAEKSASSDTTIKAGTNGQIVLAMSTYWSSGSPFWLRAPYSSADYNHFVQVAVRGHYVDGRYVSDDYALMPACNLNLSSVIFASAAKAASSENAENGKIADGTAMTLRLDGSDKTIGTVVYDETDGKIAAQKDAGAAGNVSLVVQGSDGTKDWYYSVPAGEAKVVTKEQIQTACGISGDISLADCKIWLETTIDNVAYATMAEPSQFVTAGQLKTFNTDDTDGSVNPAKIRFGKDNQEWWIVGSQSDNSLTLFAASPLATSQKFDPDYNSYEESTYTKQYSAGWNCTYTGSAPTEVNPNHYGASPLRTTLKGLETSYFSTAEQSLMKETTVYTDDTKNSSVYSTTDKLYLAYGDSDGTSGNNKYITVGANSSESLNNALRIDMSYWGTSGNFWLRAPYSYFSYSAWMAVPGSAVIYTAVDYGENALVPAFELNLSSVIFASAAKAASSGNTENGTIADGTAMTLRLDGSDKTIGTVVYDETAGKIAAQKDAGAAGTVSLVVQGSDGNKDWYYSVPAERATVVTKKQIQTACGISGDISLTDCKIWLETIIDNVAYAGMAEAKSLNAEVTLKPGETALRADETISNGTDGTVTVDKGYDGTVDTTIKLPTAGNIHITEDGKITVPAGGKVQSGDGKELTLPDGGSVDTDGNVEADKIVSGETTVTAPAGGKVTADKDGKITVPAGGKVETEGGKELTLSNGGTVDKDGTVKADKIVSGETTVTAPEGGKVTADKDGNITVPAGGTVQTGDGEEMTLPNGGTVDKDGTVSANQTQPTEKPTNPPTETPTNSPTGTPTNPPTGTPTNSPTGTPTNPPTGTPTNPPTGTPTNPPTGTPTNPQTGTPTNPPTGTPTNPPTGTPTNPPTGTPTEKPAVTVPAGGKVETESGKELTLPNGGTVDENGNVEADKIKNGETTVTAPEGGKVTADKTGNITVPAGGKVETESGKELILPNGGTVDKDETVEADKIISGDTTVTAPEGGKVTADKVGNITVPAGGTVQTGDEDAKTLPNGGTVDKDGTVSVNPAQPTNPPATEPTDKPAETPVPPANGTVSPEEVMKNSEQLDFGVTIKWKGNTFKLSWKAVQGAEGYDIFAATCGKKLNKKALVKTVKGKKRSVSLTKIAGKKLFGKKNYKYKIKAWKLIGSKKVYIRTSRTYHVVGGKNKKYTNAKKLKPTKKKYTLKKGKSVSLKVRIVKQSKKKKLLPKSHGPARRYFSDNKEVATVTSKGKVKAKGKGTCYIYVTALNGISVKIKVTVK